ncbi:MAG: guanylate kinase [Syntrophaceae bacterium]|nr:guanylate kinase [Syntrophaceae bacterium]NTW77527.1 guanylate kinase [Syntrophaceae bacterium]
MDKGTFIVVSAPSGAGKSSICQRLLQAYPEIRFSVSCTTRSPRPGEIDGQDYFFLSSEEFQKRIEQGDFAEWEENFGNLYGTSMRTMKESLANGFTVLLDIEPRGAKEIKKKFRGGTFVFVLPPSREELLKRLEGRGHEDPDAIQARYAEAERELKEISWYDYVIFNDDLETAVNQLISIYIAQKCKRSNLKAKIEQFMKK